MDSHQENDVVEFKWSRWKPKVVQAIPFLAFSVAVFIVCVVWFYIGQASVRLPKAEAVTLRVRILERKSLKCVDTVGTIRNEPIECEYPDADLTFGKTQEWWWYSCKCRK